MAYTLSQQFHSNERKFYFYWKNKINTRINNFNREISKEEFINTYLNGDAKIFDTLEAWEQSENYARIKKIYYSTITEQDFIEMYEAVREKALQGDNPSIKTFLMLQKEIDRVNKKNNSNKNKDEDDGLVI